MRRAGFAIALVLASGLVRPAGTAQADDVVTPVRIGPSADGHLGAWLLLGPYRSASNGIKGKAPDPLLTPPPDVDEEHLAPSWAPRAPSRAAPRRLRSGSSRRAARAPST